MNTENIHHLIYFAITYQVQTAHDIETYSVIFCEIAVYSHMTDLLDN